MEYIVLMPNSIKKNIIKEVRNKYYNYNIKFLSLEDFIEKYTFSYNNKTIYYLMREYNLNLSSAMVYIKNLYYIDMNIHNKKMDTLINMKKFLDDNNLLIYDKYFKEYVKNKEIYIYGYDYLNKYYLKVLEGLNYKVIDYIYNDYEVKNIYEFNYIDEEVIFVIDKILELIRSNIKPENIKLIISKEYEEVIDRLFKIYNIPINVKKRSIYSARSVKDFLNNLDDINKGLDDINDDEIRNKVISVLNNYAFIDNKKEALELIINDLMKYKNEIKKKIDDGQFILATGNSFEIFCNYIETENNNIIKCLGIFDCYAKRNLNKRHNSLFLGDFNDIAIVGYKSQFTQTYGLKNDYFIKVTKGIGINPSEKYEGIHKNNFYGTYLLGPLLVLNPYFTKYLLKELGYSKSLAFEKDSINAYNARLKELQDDKTVFGSMHN